MSAAITRIEKSDNVIATTSDLPHYLVLYVYSPNSLLHLPIAGSPEVLP